MGKLSYNFCSNPGKQITQKKLENVSPLSQCKLPFHVDILVKVFSLFLKITHLFETSSWSLFFPQILCLWIGLDLKGT